MSKGSSLKAIIFTIMVTALACSVLLLCGGGVYLYLVAPETLNAIMQGDGTGLVSAPVAATATSANPPATLSTPAEATATLVSAGPTPASHIAAPVEGAGVSAGNTYEQATTITPGQYTGKLIDKKDEAWYKFEVPGGGIINLTFTAGDDLADGFGKSQSITIFNPDRKEIAWQTKVERGKLASFRWVISDSQGGVYYLRVSGGRLYVDLEPDSDGTGSYSFELALQNQNDANSGGDVGDEFAQATVIQIGQPVSGQIGGSDKEDWYKFELSGGQILDLTFTPSPDVKETQSIFAFDAQGKQPIWEAQHVLPSVKQPGQWLMDIAQGGTYYLQITYGYLKDGTGSYALELAARPQNDANSGTDAGAEPEQSLEIQPGQLLTGQVGDFDKFDCYKFTPASGQTISFTPGQETKGMGIQLFNANLKEIWRENQIGPTVTKTHQLTEVTDRPYYLCVGNWGSYTVGVK
ncbi:MAG: hypothetical protein DPW09_22650 [Anaerolineae bacterium]|nr:hypothetical protein [Anaerolineales bacterium]MCQ3976238.1 hypothetical protein [Anaerolineae bacterium]